MSPIQQRLSTSPPRFQYQPDPQPRRPPTRRSARPRPAAISRERHIAVSLVRQFLSLRPEGWHGCTSGGRPARRRPSRRAHRLAAESRRPHPLRAGGAHLHPARRYERRGSRGRPGFLSAARPTAEAVGRAPLRYRRPRAQCLVGLCGGGILAGGRREYRAGRLWPGRPVGGHSADFFTDGALRLVHRRDIGPSTALRLGVGAWGGAQPGVERFDIGPRAAISLPVAGTTMSAAIEGRIRIAGDADPGSSVALTLASDF